MQSWRKYLMWVRDALTSHAMQDMKENRLKILCETWVLFRRKLYLTDASSKESPRDTHLELWKGFWRSWGCFLGDKLDLYMHRESLITHTDSLKLDMNARQSMLHIFFSILLNNYRRETSLLQGILTVSKLRKFSEFTRYNLISKCHSPSLFLKM